jgi:hypothetical protein
MLEPINQFAPNPAAWDNLNVGAAKTVAEIMEDIQQTVITAMALPAHLVTNGRLPQKPKDDGVPRDCYGNDLRADIAGREIARAARKFANRRRYVRMMARRGVYIYA